MVSILVSDTPNQGRVKINSNFDYLLDEVNKKISSDGTTLLSAPLNMNSQQIINLGAGTTPTSAVNKEQMDTGDNQLVVDRYIYVSEVDKVLYIDGTNANYGVKVSDIDVGLSFAKAQNDATTGYEWTIKIPFRSTYYRGQTFKDFSDYLNIFGEGKPIIEIIDGTTAGVADIIGNSKLDGVTLIYKTGKELNIGGNVKINNCDIFMTDLTGVIPRKLKIGGASVTNCRLVADDIILDATTGNYVDDCIINVENFTNPENNETNAVNKTIVNLENYYSIYNIL